MGFEGNVSEVTAVATPVAEQATVPVPAELSSAIGRIRPSLAGVGRIETNQPVQVNGKTGNAQSFGTGFIVDKNQSGCLMYTKEHTVHDLRDGAMRDAEGNIATAQPGSNGPDISVTLPEVGKLKAKVLVADQATDSAVLELATSNPEGVCKTVPMAKTAQDLNLQELSIVVGYDGKTGELNGLTGIVGGALDMNAVEKAGAPPDTRFVSPQYNKHLPLIAIYGVSAPEGYSGGPSFNAKGEVTGSSHAAVGTSTLLTPVDIIKQEVERAKAR